jgi:transmembrane sensor
MNPQSPPPIDDDVLSQAADWCVRLHEDDSTPADRAAFALWVQADPRHALEYGKMLEIWELCSELPKHEGTVDSLLTVSSPHHNGSIDI